MKLEQSLDSQRNPEKKNTWGIARLDVKIYYKAVIVQSHENRQVGQQKKLEDQA